MGGRMSLIANQDVDFEVFLDTCSVKELLSEMWDYDSNNNDEMIEWFKNKIIEQKPLSPEVQKAFDKNWKDLLS